MQCIRSHAAFEVIGYGYDVSETVKTGLFCPSKRAFCSFCKCVLQNAFIQRAYL